MADASLNIPITADASKFLNTLGQVEDRLESLRKSLKTAKGDDIGFLNIEVQDFEQQKKAIENYGRFAKGTFGSLLQQLKDLKAFQFTLNYNSAEFKEVQADIDATKAKIKDLTSTPKQIEVKFEAPQGSIAAFKKQLKELEFMKSIQVDTTAIQQYASLINSVKSEIKQLESIGVEIPAPKIDDAIVENSILDLRNQIDKLNAKKINIDIANEGEIAKLNQQIEELTQKLKGAESVSFDKQGKISQNANKARQTITNLKLVIQDLPFGFIAIQNNIPNLLESFGALNTKSGGLRGALKDLAGQLIGPAGIFLAISTVTAAITFAIQKYGSLDLAVKAFLGTAKEVDFVNKRAAESLKKYNEELTTTNEITATSSAKAAGEVARINILSQAVRDNTLSQTQRANALKELQQIDPKTLESLNLQRDGYEKLDGWVKTYTDSLIANAVAQEYLSRVVAVTTQINTQTNLLAELSKGYEDIAKKRREAEGQPTFDPATGADLTPTILGGLAKRTENLNKVFSDQANIVNGLYKELDKYKKSAQDATNEALKFFKEGTRGAGDGGTKNVFIPEIDARQLDEAYNLDTIISNLTKYGNAVVDVNKSEKERQNALKELIEINPKYFESFKLGVTPISKVREALEELILSLRVEKKEREDGLRVSQLSAQFRKQEEKGIESLGSKYGTLNKEVSAFPTTMEEINSQLDENVKATNRVVEGIVPLANINRATEPLKFLQEQFQLAYTAINQVFFAPLENLFETFLTKGEITFKDFAKAVGKSIADIAAKLAATGVIKGLLFLLDPSGALAGFGGSFGGSGGGNGILDALGGVFGRSQRKPDFNRVSPPRTYGGDRVEFTIRGTNLVGVLNRANGEINRIG
jgi:hypothetical protein